MFTRRVLHRLCGVAILGLFATSSTGAYSNPHRTTYFTFSRAVQLPGALLPAGSYTFELADPHHAFDIVHVMSRDRERVRLTAFTRIIERPASEELLAAVVFGESSASTPPQINAWYPQDERVGRQFIY
jgi:hypothetical protein